MAPVTENRGWYYVKTPEDVPKADAIFELRSADVPVMKEEMILIKTLGASIAPHTRAFLKLPGNDTGAEAAGLKRTEIGQVVPCELVAEVVESTSKKYAVGDRVLTFAPLYEYQALPVNQKDMILTKLNKWMTAESMLGMTASLTAWLAVNDHPCGRVEDPGCAGGLSACFSFLRPRQQKTVLVTSAAGGVGIVAGQLYKSKGCKVIGVTSTREKADRLLEYGFDAAIAYKTEDLDARLGELASEGLDVFFDNVGAGQLDAGSKHMKVGGKILSVGCCAEIDNYASGNITGWKEYHRMVARELLVGGFFLTNHLKRAAQAMMSMMILQSRGKLKPAQTVLFGGFERFAECVDRLHDGATFGRLVLMFGDDPSKGA